MHHGAMLPNGIGKQKACWGSLRIAAVNKPGRRKKRGSGKWLSHSVNDRHSVGRRSGVGWVMDKRNSMQDSRKDGHDGNQGKGEQN